MTQRWSVAGVDLEVAIVHPDAPGPLLLFLHQGLGSVLHWRDWPTQIANDCESPALIYSRQGYGTSDELPGPRTARFLNEAAEEELPALLSVLFDTHPALRKRPRILIGHSDGASIALLYASDPQQPNVEGVVAIAPHVFVEDICITAIAALRESFPDSKFRERLARYHRNIDRTFDAWSTVWLSPSFRSWTMTEEVARLDVPTLLIQGYDDAFGTMAQCDAIVKHASGPVDQLRLAHCGHSPPRERPNITRDAIVSFVRRTLQGPQGRSR
ncbi:MAG: alpha/beta hydrolase [Myxococcota bacterium]